MARKLVPELIKELKEGKYAKILREIIQDPELSLEVRTGGEAKVYYNKGCVLTLSAKKFKGLDPKYIKDGRPVPETDLKNPKKYLSEVKELVRAHSKKLEFSIQQNIATSNRGANCEYFIVDMEYQFPQHDIPEYQRLGDKTRIDLVGIERETGNIILFELKQGLSALSGKSGVEDHFDKMMQHIDNVNFDKILREDVATIIKDKKELGIIPANTPEPKPDGRIKIIYIFAYNSDEDRVEYEKKYDSYKTIYIDTRYKLSSAK
jgi:hypothetical protein